MLERRDKLREIKFRAFIKKTKEMCKLTDIRFKAQEVCVEHKDTTFDFLDFNEVEIMQYTGMKDEGGTEIYEGDILNCPSVDGSVVVSFCDEKYQFVCDDIDSLYDYEGYSVIGNIYENPELLESDIC